MRITAAVIVAFCLAVLLGSERGAAGNPGGSCSATVLVAVFQDDVFIGIGDTALVDVDLEYFVALQMAPGCAPLPAGGRLILTMPDGRIFGPPSVPEITPDAPFLFGPVPFTPDAAWCPLLQATAIYRPLDGGFVSAATGLTRTPLEGCPCSADNDGNGQVDVDDLVGVILQWGVCDEVP